MLGQQAPGSAFTGQLGSTFIGDTAPYTGQWGQIYCLAPAVFSVLTSGADSQGQPIMKGNLTTLPLAAGQSIYGLFTSITLTSGKIIAYNV
jgi:hypothetical protein